LDPVTYLIFRAHPLWLFSITLLLLLLSIELPYRYGRRLMNNVDLREQAWGVVQTSLLALVAFMLGFSFAEAESRFDARRALVVREAALLGQTWLRADFLPGNVRAFRRILTDYADIRLRAVEQPWNDSLREQATTTGAKAQSQLWSIASTALNAAPAHNGRSLLVQSLNDTVDVSTEQFVALTQHVPTPIIVLTLLLLVLGTLSIGFGFARVHVRPLALSLAYVISIAVVFAMIVDIDRPQTGTINVNLQPLEDQVRQMKAQ
jgi:hypothetical protein